MVQLVADRAELELAGKKTPGFIFLLLVFFILLSCASRKPVSSSPASFPRQEIIIEIKTLEKRLGFSDSRSFSKSTSQIEAYHRCYYTEKLKLPASYEGLRTANADEAGCSIDEDKYDVFFYPIEAVATRSTPVTSSLRETSLERFMVVVPHEDFHLHKEVRKLPEPIAEAAATLVGFLTAAELAETKFSRQSETFKNLSREPGLFLRKARIVAAYYARLSELYRTVRSGETAEKPALARKKALFAALQQECKAIRPKPKSFNPCPGANNNAGLAFDMTYARHYPLLYDLFLAQGRDLKATIDAVKGAKASSEEEVARQLQDLIAQKKKEQRDCESVRDEE